MVELPSAFRGFRFPGEVIIVAVRMYLRYRLTYRDVEELMSERGVDVGHVAIWRWVHRFTPLLEAMARPARHCVGTIWMVDETYVKVAGKQRYVYRAIDQHGQIVDVYVSRRRNGEAARRFFQRARAKTSRLEEVVTDRHAPYLRAVEDEAPAAFHNRRRYANNRIESDHGPLKTWLRPMRGLKRDDCAQRVMSGHALVRNIRNGHYALADDDVPAKQRVKTAFDELAKML